MTTRRPTRLSTGALALVAIAAAGLAGCRADRMVADSYPKNYEQRHPIVLAEGATKLELPVGAGSRGLTERQRDDIRAFAADWRKNGRGPIGMMAPSGGAGDWATPAIRTTLASAGVPSTSIVSQRYRGEPGEVQLVKLGYVKLKAQVPHKCGLWPADLGGTADAYTATENRDYWNYGCATQQNLAAQVADPEDLARPRAETPVYAARRGVVLDKYRQGEDTATQYGQQEPVISDVGGGK